MTDRLEQLRMAEAALFASSEPVDERALAERLPKGADIPSLLAELEQSYAGRGVNLIKVGGKWMFRTAPDLAFILQREVEERRRLSRAAIETLAIIAYHQPVTRVEIEEQRGVGLSKGTLDLLMETGWVRPVGRRRTPGRPVTWGTSQEFLTHFGLESLDVLPGLEELKATGLLESEAPSELSPLRAVDDEDETEAELPLSDDARALP